MKTYSIKPKEKISLQIRGGFYIAQAMVSIKAIGVPNPGNTQSFSFAVRYLNANGTAVGFSLVLFSPYYFNAGGYASNDPNFQGPYYFVEIESSEYNPELAIQVGFTNQLA